MSGQQHPASHILNPAIELQDPGEDGRGVGSPGSAGGSRRVPFSLPALTLNPKP